MTKRQLFTCSMIPDLVHTAKRTRSPLSHYLLQILMDQTNNSIHNAACKPLHIIIECDFLQITICNRLYNTVHHIGGIIHRSIILSIGLEEYFHPLTLCIETVRHLLRVWIRFSVVSYTFLLAFLNLDWNTLP